MRGKQWSLLAVVVLLSLWMGACGSEPTPTPMPPAATATPVPPTDSPVPAAPSDTAVPSSTPVPPTATPPPPTDTPTSRPTSTPTEPPSPTATPVPPTDTATSEPTAVPTKPPPTATRVPASPTAKPQPTAAPTQPPPPGENQGCYLFQNFLGADVTVTLTAQDWEWSGSFTLAPSGEQLYCLDPGRYTFTLDAPPPWGSTNGELDVHAGDRYLFPIRGRE